MRLFHGGRELRSTDDLRTVQAGCSIVTSAGTRPPEDRSKRADDHTDERMYEDSDVVAWGTAKDFKASGAQSRLRRQACHCSAGQDGQ